MVTLPVETCPQYQYYQSAELVWLQRELGAIGLAYSGYISHMHMAPQVSTQE